MRIPPSKNLIHKTSNSLGLLNIQKIIYTQKIQTFFIQAAVKTNGNQLNGKNVFHLHLGELSIFK